MLIYLPESTQICSSSITDVDLSRHSGLVQAYPKSGLPMIPCLIRPPEAETPSKDAVVRTLEHLHHCMGFVLLRSICNSLCEFLVLITQSLQSHPISFKDFEAFIINGFPHETKIMHENCKGNSGNSNAFMVITFPRVI